MGASLEWSHYAQAYLSEYSNINPQPWEILDAPEKVKQQIGRQL